MVFVPALSSYTSQVRRLLHDPNSQYYQPSDVTAFINLARSHVAREGQCIRVLLSGGTVTGFTNLVGGHNYSPATTVVLTGSGAQAFATPTIFGGAIMSINLISGGFGYLTPPTVAFVDSTGSGASASAVVDNTASTIAGREVYKFSDLNVLAVRTPGVQQILGILGIASQWGAGNTYKPTLNHMIWSEFQAYTRVYANSQVNFPAIWSSYGQGASGSFYLFPVPSQQMAMDIDTYCVPIDIASDQDPEAIPYPWTEAVQYWAAYLAYNNSQRKGDADRMEVYYQKELRTVRAASEPPFVPSPYYDGVY